MIFANPSYIYLLLLLIPLIGWYFWKMRKNQASVEMSSSQAFDAPKAVTAKVYLRHVPFVLRMIAIALVIVILARPQSTNSWQNSSTEGIDIMMAIDISSSMLAQDLRPNRLEAAKNVAAAFINGRPNDNIGLVVFSAESFTQCPLTTIALVIVILARPQSTNSWQNSSTEGIDIMMAIDISSSMLAQDLRPNRLEAAKNVAAAFINGRPNDNIGLVVFSAESFTQCPLTTDHAILLNLFKNIQSGMIEDGTAIGLGLANAVSRIKDSQAKSKVIILLTDGSNNRGEIAPVTAAEIAKTFGIRVYTIGVGTKGEAPYPFRLPGGMIQTQMIPVDIDEPTLKQIATTTGGQYFRATDNASLKEIYSEIDQMEKTKISVREYSKKQEEYKNIALLLLALLLLELLLKHTLLKKIP